MVKEQNNKPGSGAVRAEKDAAATVFPAKERMLVKTRAFKSIVRFSASVFCCSSSVGGGGRGGSRGGGAVCDEPEPLPEPNPKKKDDAAFQFPPKKKRKMVKTTGRFVAPIFCSSSCSGGN